MLRRVCRYVSCRELCGKSWGTIIAHQVFLRLLSACCDWTVSPHPIGALAGQQGKCHPNRGKPACRDPNAPKVPIRPFPRVKSKLLFKNFHLLVLPVHIRRTPARIQAAGLCRRQESSSLLSETGATQPLGRRAIVKVCRQRGCVPQPLGRRTVVP